MAGVSRLQYPPEIRMIRVMCSGRVDISFVLRAFLNGIDGVFIAGCRLNECNYTTQGNYYALSMTLLCKRIMDHLGLNPDRLKVEFMSSAEGIRFAQVVSDFSKKIGGLGPLGESERLGREEIKDRLKKAIKLVPYIKIVEKEKLGARLGSYEEYEKLYTREEIEELFSDVPSYYIDPEKCQACMICARRCPAEAIEGGKSKIHVIDQDRCIRCGTCYDVCPTRFGAVKKIVGGPVPEPIPEEKRTISRKRQKK